MANNNPTLGTIWENKKTGRQFELVAINGTIQLSSIGEGEQTYNIMTKASLRKNYKLVAMKAPPVIIKPIEEIQIENESQKTNSSSTKGRGLIELGNGDIVKGTDFIAQMTDIHLKYPSDAIYWLRTTKKGQAVLAEHGAKIVYGKPLTKSLEKK